MQGSKFLKVTGILMIIFGAIALVLSIIGIAGIGMVASLATALGEDISVGLLTVSCILSLLGAVAELVAGIVGIKNWANPKKAGTCIVWGIIVIAFCLLSNILTLVGYPENFNFVNVVTGLVIPVLYLVGGFQTKKLQG